MSKASSPKQGANIALWISLATAVCIPLFGMASLNGRALHGVVHVISGWLPAFGQLAVAVAGSILIALIIALVSRAIVRRSRSA